MQLAAGPSNLATTIRLMAGHELVTEGFAEGQVGSSAMPHKMNTRSCERVNGLAVVLRGYLSMVGELAGDQWNEGDVSCSVVRRVALPDAFFAADGLFRTFITVLDEFGAFPAVIQRELDRYLPFLATTKVLMAAVRRGVGREAAHEAIKEAAVGAALDLRKGAAENDVVDRLAADDRLGLTRDRHRGPDGQADLVHRRRRRPDPGGRPPRGAGRGRRPRRRGVLTRRHPLSVMTSTAVQVRVTGRVQGVAFRWEAQHAAEKLGVTGWVRNEPDGSVAAHVEGEPDAVNDMVVWLRTGPPAARVSNVAVRDAAPTRRRLPSRSPGDHRWLLDRLGAWRPAT